MITRSLSARLAALLLAIPVALAACASDDDGIGQGDDDITVGVGQICAGGFAPATCSPGLKCEMRGRIGKCVVDPTAQAQGASEGEACGGTERVKCKTGLTCKTKTTSATAKGTCVEAERTCLAMPTCDEGHTKVANADACPQDASCYRRSRCGKTIWCTDAAPEGAGPGERCGTGFAGTIACRPGLTCSATIGLGTCR